MGGATRRPWGPPGTPWGTRHPAVPGTDALIRSMSSRTPRHTRPPPHTRGSFLGTRPQRIKPDDSDACEFVSVNPRSGARTGAARAARTRPPSEMRRRTSDARRAYLAYGHAHRRTSHFGRAVARRRQPATTARYGRGSPLPVRPRQPATGTAVAAARYGRGGRGGGLRLPQRSTHTSPYGRRVDLDTLSLGHAIALLDTLSLSSSSSSISLPLSLSSPSLSSLSHFLSLLSLLLCSSLHQLQVHLPPPATKPLSCCRPFNP